MPTKKELRGWCRKKYGSEWHATDKATRLNEARAALSGAATLSAPEPVRGGKKRKRGSLGTGGKTAGVKWHEIAQAAIDGADSAEERKQLASQLRELHRDANSSFLDVRIMALLGEATYQKVGGGSAMAEGRASRDKARPAPTGKWYALAQAAIDKASTSGCQRLVAQLERLLALLGWRLGPGAMGDWKHTDAYVGYQ